MAALAVQPGTKEIEKVISENSFVETSKTDNESLVALSSENIDAPITKFSSDDSGILCKNDSETSSSASVKSVELNAEENEQSQDQKATEDKSSQISSTQNCSLMSSQLSSKSDSASSPKKFANEDSNSSFHSKSKRSQCINNDDENSCSSVRSTSTVKTSQCTKNESDDESNNASSSRCSSRRSSPQKNSQNTSFKGSQSARSDFTEDSNSRSSLRRSVSRSPNKGSQSVSYKSDDDTSRSSFQSSRKTSPEKRSQNITTDLSEDNDSRSPARSSSSRSTVRSNSQVKADNQDENSRSSSTSSKQNTPEKSNNDKENKKKKYSIIDSDSEDETTMVEESKLDSENSQSPKTVDNSKIKSKRLLIDSDSDEEIISVNKNSNTDSSNNRGQKKSTSTQKSNKISSIIDSDSESDRESDHGNDSAKEHSKTVQKSNKMSLIIDSDSESDVDRSARHDDQERSDNENETSKSKKGKKKSEKKRAGSARASKDAAMQQIHSETQRLIRESHISLPYHRPKQRTLEEFLNRKKTPSNLPKNFTNAERIQMFPEIISKVVKEKEKEAEDFYQSSDSEDDENHDKTMEIEEIGIENKTDNNVQGSENSDLIQIFHTQKLTQDDIQESHNKKDILLQRSLDFGATRKLFVDDIAGREDSVKSQITEKHPSPIENMDAETIAISTSTDNVEHMELDQNKDQNNSSMAEKEKKKEANGSEQTDLSKKSTELENSIEDIVLNISETENDSSEGKKMEESGEIKNIDSNTMNKESATMSEKSPLNVKETGETSEINTVNGIHKSSDSGNSIHNADKSKESDSEAITGEEDDGEILDKNMLRTDFFRPPDAEKSTKELGLRAQRIKDRILSSSSKLKPMIKSSPGCVIDLTSAGPIKEGATKLLDRYLSRHTPVHKSTVEEVAKVKIMRTEGVGDDLKIVEEILPFKKLAVEDDRRERKAGERFQLKKDLMLKIASARDEEWKHKEEDENEEDEEESKCRGDDFYEGLPDEEELLEDEEDEETGESEPEEDDMPIVEKSRRKCEFGDEEAEESDVDADEENGAENEEEEEDEDEEESESESESEKEERPRKPKKLRRILTAFEDDSNESGSGLSNDASKKAMLERAKTDEDMFASQVSNECANPEVEPETIPPFQFRERCDSDSRSQACKTPLPKSTNILSMISPVAQLTALNTSLESAKKSASKTNNFDFGQISSQNTPTEGSDRIQSNCSIEKMVSLQKKLFEDPTDPVNEDELLALCSGKFTDTQSSGVPTLGTQNGVTDSQLMDICSGAFGSPAVEGAKTGASSTDIENGVTDSQLMDICSGTFASPAVEGTKAGASPADTRNGVTDSQLMDICPGVFNTPCTDEKKIDDTVLVGDETSQDITLAIEDDEDSKSSPVKRTSSLKRSDESMFSSDSSKMSKSSTNDKDTFKNPMEAWLKRATAKPTQPHTQVKDNEVTDSQLIGLCSGAFTSQPIDMKQLEENVDSLNHDEVSQDFQLTFDDNSNDSSKDVTEKSKDQEILPPSKNIEEQPKLTGTGLRIASSSEDEDSNKQRKEKPKKKVLKKKKVAKLELSDDEDEGPKEFSDEESEMEDDDEEKFVDYDSEENEVIVVPKKEIKKVAKKFLENEAELSESDWDSADEDEHGMDKLEVEEGDAEDIDEDKMKDELDRIHMKQVMDEDQRDVRMLQELLFDDGDLHSEGAGRERKFKWKNIDSMGTDDLVPSTEDDPGVIDDEVDTAVELQMRKMRYEQLKFQEEKGQTIESFVDEDFGESTLSKTGLKVVSLRKTAVEEQVMNKAKSIDNSIKVVTKSSMNFTKKSLTTSFSYQSNMRGSFLARGEDTLVRIAQNLPEKSSVSVSSMRNKKFVFEHLSPSVSNDQKCDSEQENDDTPSKDKKGNARKRKIFSSQTPRSTKKIKVDERAAGKKLF